MEWRKEWRLEMSKKNDGQYKDFVPYEKSSKKEKKRRDNQKRNTWEIPCYTKIEPDKKKKKDRRDKRKRDKYYDDEWCDNYY